MIGMKKGLFGKGMMPGPMDSAMPAYSMPQDMGVQDANFGGGGGAMPAKGGGLKNVLMAALGGAADGASQFFGGQPLIAQNRQFQMLQGARMAEEQRRRAAELADFERKQQIEAKYRAPKVNDTVADFEWFKSLSPQDRALYEQMRPVYRQGPDGQFYRVDTAQQQPAGFDALPPGYSVRQGGAASNGSGNFR